MLLGTNSLDEQMCKCFFEYRGKEGKDGTVVSHSDVDPDPDPDV